MALFSPQADDINVIVNDVPDLTHEERMALISAMKKAKEFDAQEKNKMSKPFSGQLYKYTNVVKGWQYRFFVLIPDSGILEYYMLDEVKRRPRGAVYLAGAVISPSDEDSQSFTISAACGEVYKLKAEDAKERQLWVNRIRAVAERHTDTIAEKNPPLPPREIRSPFVSGVNSASDNQSVWYTNLQSVSNKDSPLTPYGSTRKSTHNRARTRVRQSASSITEAFTAVREMLLQTDSRLSVLTKSIESLPCTGNGPKCCDTDMLLLKATSAATLKSLQQCYTILQHQQVAINFPKAVIENRQVQAASGVMQDSKESSTGSASPVSKTGIDPSGEALDYDVSEESELHLDSNQHSDILNLMSQLKLGADLTKVTLPSFVLESRSLLEMFSDFMRHPDLFIKISNCPSTEERMLAVLEWYLTSFHAAWEVLSKKPYNPMLGEMFRCSWNVPRRRLSIVDKLHEDFVKVTFVAEQVSHHPPVSAFYVECPKENMAMNAHICIKSNFLTSYVAVNFIGEVKLQLLNFGETYLFSLPSAHIRNLLTVPWIELGGRVNISCATSDYSAFVTFQTKPHVSAAPHQITGEVKHGNELLYHISGEWNGVLQISALDNSKRSSSIDVSNLPRQQKSIRPLEEQSAFESRKLWLEVTRALRDVNQVKADEEKLKLENHQREEESKRTESSPEYQGKLFHKVNDIWEYKYPL